MKVVSTTIEEESIKEIDSLVSEKQNKSVVLRNCIKIGLGVLLSQKKEVNNNEGDPFSN